MVDRHEAKTDKVLIVCHMTSLIPSYETFRKLHNLSIQKPISLPPFQTTVTGASSLHTYLRQALSTSSLLRQRTLNSPSKDSTIYFSLLRSDVMRDGEWNDPY